jgi:hypothetical protein
MPWNDAARAASALARKAHAHAHNPTNHPTPTHSGGPHEHFPRSVAAGHVAFDSPSGDTMLVRMHSDRSYSGETSRFGTARMSAHELSSKMRGWGYTRVAGYGR